MLLQLNVPFNSFITRFHKCCMCIHELFFGCETSVVDACNMGILQVYGDLKVDTAAMNSTYAGLYGNRAEV